MFITDTCIKRPILATVMLLVVSIVGAISYTKLAVELFPDIEFPVVVATTIYRGAGPEEIEQMVTKPIEDNLSLVDNVKYIESVSSEGVSTVFVRFEMGTDIDVAVNDVRDQISRVESKLPDDAEKPSIMKIDPNAQPIIRLSVSGERTMRELYDLTDDKIKTQLSKVSGVGLVRIIGGEKREIRVAVSQDRLDAAGISIARVINAIAQGNVEMPGGRISAARQEYLVRVLGKIEDIKRIADITIPGAAGRVTVGDVARVFDTVEEIRTKAGLDGKPSIGIEILKRGKANSIRVGRGVRNAIARLKSGLLPSDVEITVVTDESIFIRDVVNEVNTNMAEGIILTALALFLFLHNWRGTFITALAMPTSVVASYIAIYAAGYSINIMSMLGLAISIGTLVNNAILVLENIHRLIDLGMSPADAASKGTSEIAVAVTGTTLTNVVVFLPIAFMQSIVGQVFRQFAMTVVFATFFSLFISFTLTPMMAALLLKPRGDQLSPLARKLKRIYARWDAFYDAIASDYRRAVESVLRHPWLTIMTGFAVLVVVMVTVPRLIGGEFFPASDEGEFVVQIEADVASSLDYAESVTRKVEELCGRIPEREKIFSTVGSSSGDRFRSVAGVNLAQVVVKLVDKSDRNRSTVQIMDWLRRELAAVPGARFTVSATKRGGPGGKPIVLEIRGEDFAVLNRIAVQVLELARSVQGLVDLDTDWRTGKPEFALRPVQRRLKIHDVTVAAVADTVRSSYDGAVASRFREGDREYDIRVKLDESDRLDDNRILDLAVPTADGRSNVKLGELVERAPSTGPTQISRKDREHLVRVTANVSGTTPAEAHKALLAKLEAVPLPEGYSFNWAGDIESMKENFSDLYTAMILATVLTYLMLAGLLESWKLSLLVMLTLPISFAGVFVALLIRGSTINIFSLMGMVMLIGLVINNAIVIVDYIEVLRREGRPLRQAIPEACAVRLRPMLMANITDVAAMWPLALGHGAGGEFRAPMAVAQMGGMIGGSLLALFIAPALYWLARRRSERQSEHPAEAQS